MALILSTISIASQKRGFAIDHQMNDTEKTAIAGFTWRHGSHVIVLLTKEFWLFLLFGTLTWPLCLLSFMSLGIGKPRIWKLLLSTNLYQIFFSACWRLCPTTWVYFLVEMQRWRVIHFSTLFFISRDAVFLPQMVSKTWTLL